MKNEDTILELTEIIEEALEPSMSMGAKKLKYDISKDQPKHCSWIHFFWSYGGLAGEYPHALTYSDAQEFQGELVKKIRAVFTPQTLEYIRQAKITEFGMHIGPYQPSGGNLNDELGIEVHPEMHDRKAVDHA